MNEIYLLNEQRSISETDFRALHENISFPSVLSKEALAEYNAVTVLASPQPSTTPFQSVQRNGVAQDSLGNYVQAWSITNWSQDQINTYVAAGKESRWEAIKSFRDQRKQGGVLVGTKWFHSDDASRIQQLGLLMLGANIPTNLQWKTMDGTFVTMTQTLAGQIFQAAAASDMTIFAKAEWHKAQMEAAASTGGDPSSYDFSQGWPPIYGE